MVTSYVFQAAANPSMPKDWVYTRPRLPASTDAATRILVERHSMAGESMVDVEVTFGELDDGINVEWKVSLRPSCFTKAKTSYTVGHGYMLKEVLLRSSQYDVARQTASINVSEAFQWREQHVKH